MTIYLAISTPYSTVTDGRTEGQCTMCLHTTLQKVTIELLTLGLRTNTPLLISCRKKHYVNKEAFGITQIQQLRKEAKNELAAGRQAARQCVLQG